MEHDEHVIMHHLDIFCQYGRGFTRQAGDIDAAENWLARMAEATKANQDAFKMPTCMNLFWQHASDF